MEAKITVNGIQLSETESRVVRVALTNLHADVSIKDTLGSDETGEAIRQGYLNGAEAVLRMIGVIK